MIYLSKKEFDDAMEKVMAKFKELENKIDLVKSDTALMIRTSNRIVGNVEHSQQIPPKGDHNHTKKVK